MVLLSLLAIDNGTMSSKADISTLVLHMEKGKAEAQLAIAKRLLEKDLPHSEIAEATGLSVTDIKRLHG